MLGFIDVTTYYHGTPRSDRPSDSGSLDRHDWLTEGSSALVEKTDLTQAIGDTWLARGSTALLSVPAIVPETFNVLLNPAQQDANRIVIAQTSEHAL